MASFLLGQKHVGKILIATNLTLFEEGFFFFSRWGSRVSINGDFDLS